MSEVLRFRLARDVQRSTPAAGAVVPVVRDGKQTRFVESLRAAVLSEKDPLGSLRVAARAMTEDPGRFVHPERPGTPSGGPKGPVPEFLPVVEGLRQLEGWLAAVDNQPHPNELAAQLQAVASDLDLAPGPAGADGAAIRIVSDRRWPQAWNAIGDSLQAALVLGSASGLTATVAPGLLRLLLVAGLVEAVASRELAPATPAEVLRLLRERIVVLPAPPFPLAKYLPVQARLARAPGFADLWVVREEWACYLPGEIAHIENVLKGELKERVHTRIDETETTQTRETETARVEEHDSQTTDRFKLNEEASRDTELAISVEAQVDTSGQYGPTRVQTHIGGSLEYSVEESRRHATELAQETVERAVRRVEERTREERVRRTLTRVEEKNTHRMDNATNPDGNVVGVYRWVDKVQRLQLFRYPHRYLLEFQVPEPAAYLRWLAAKPGRGAHGLPEPPPSLTVGGRPLTAADITEKTYQDYAARYQVSGLEPPPSEIVSVATAVIFDPEDPTTQNAVQNVLAPPKIAKTVELAIMDGYQAVRAHVAVTATPAHAIWGDHPDDSADHWDWRDGYHYLRADVTLCGATIPLQDEGQPTVRQVGEFRHGWMQRRASLDLPAAATGTVTVAVVAAGTYRAAVSISVECHRMEGTLTKWQLDTYTQIVDTYFAQRQAYEAQRAAAEVERGVAVDGRSPARNQEVVREELKRQVIELLLGYRFSGVDGLTPGSDAEPPRIDLDRAAAAAPFVQFLEQAFEWDKLTFVLYAYFWAAQPRWDELQGMSDPDPEMARFLRCGSARVVVSARRGFEHAVNHFLLFGEQWGSGPAPAPEDPLYISVAQEIRDLTGAPADGEPGQSWEVRLPTTLVWLDTDPKLPKYNPSGRLTQPQGTAALCRP